MPIEPSGLPWTIYAAALSGPIVTLAMWMFEIKARRSRRRAEDAQTILWSVMAAEITDRMRRQGNPVLTPKIVDEVVKVCGGPRELIFNDERGCSIG